MLGQYRLSGAHSGKTPSPGHGLSAPRHGTRSNANWAPGMLTRSWFRSVRATEGGGGFLLCNLHCSLLLHGYIQSATFDQVAKSAEVTFQHYKLLDVQDSSVHSTKDTTKSNEMWQLAWQDLTETNLKQSFEMTPWETPFMLKNTDSFLRHVRFAAVWFPPGGETLERFGFRCAGNSSNMHSRNCGLAAPKTCSHWLFHGRGLW